MPQPQYTTMKMAQSWHKYRAADFMESQLSMKAVAKAARYFFPMTTAEASAMEKRTDFA
jgi:hypothetical protein